MIISSYVFNNIDLKIIISKYALFTNNCSYGCHVNQICWWNRSGLFVPNFFLR